MRKHTVHVHMEVYNKVIYREQFNNKTSRRHIRRNRSFQYEGPQVPQVTYGKGREGNAFVSQCLPSMVSPVHAKSSLKSFLVLNVQHSVSAGICLFFII